MVASDSPYCLLAGDRPVVRAGQHRRGAERDTGLADRLGREPGQLTYSASARRNYQHV
nr:hypothetical protein [Streptomyces sp. S1D4-11]QIY94191.1 hypothetical protein HEP87_09235 [Streptomyces sp. S1D4-11]